MNVHWHRRDLRVADNRAVAEAASDGDSLLPVFVLDPRVLDHASPPRVAFLLSALDSLRADYRELGGDLLVVRGYPSEELPRIADEYDVETVYWNRDYSGLATERDREVRSALEGARISRATYHDDLLHEPGSIRTNAGEYYSVFSYFWKKWRDREKADPFDAPEGDEIADPAVSAVPSLADLGFEEPEAEIPEAGTAAARDRLGSFCEEAIFRYADERDYPARDATSRLSVHLKWGTIGVREVWRATEEARARAEGDPEDADDEDSDEESDAASVEAYQRQLAWRDFYGHVLSVRPDTVSRNYKRYENPIEWRDDPEGLQAWKDGRTGYPIVDAGMRQLREEAWMHNRLRMVVASFLTKGLLLDWREGYAWFREKLADHDTANDVGGWQWAASTGTDAQPYFRVFNPTTQGERYDPDAEFIREYVSELRDVSAERIHEWHELRGEERARLAPDYPPPVVNHAERRQKAIEMFERARDQG